MCVCVCVWRVHISFVFFLFSSLKRVCRGHGVGRSTFSLSSSLPLFFLFFSLLRIALSRVCVCFFGRMLIAAKILVSSLFCTAGTINPFITLILQDHHYTAEETGTLISLSKIVSLLLTPLLCAAADTYRCHVPLLVVVSLVAALLMLLWWGVIPAHQPGGGGGAAFGAGTYPAMNDTLADVEGFVGPAVRLDGAKDPIFTTGDLLTTSLLPTGPGVRRRRGPAASTAAPPLEATFGMTLDLSAVLTALLLGLYYTISGSKSVITDALVMKQIELSVSGSGNRSTSSNVGAGKPSDPLLSPTAAPGDCPLRGKPISSSPNSAEKEALTVTVAAPKKDDTTATAAYPLQRLWGSISYGCTASLTGVLVKYLGGGVGGSEGGGGEGTASPPFFSPGSSSKHASEVDKGKSSQTLHSTPYLIVPLLHAVSLLAFASAVVVVERRSGLRRQSASFSGGNHSSGNDGSAPKGEGQITIVVVEASEDAGNPERTQPTRQPKPAATTGPAARTATAPSSLLARARQPLTAAALSASASSPVWTSSSFSPGGAEGKLSSSSCCSRDYLVYLFRVRMRRGRELLVSSCASMQTTLTVYAYLLGMPSFTLPLFLGSFFLTLAEMTTWLFLFPYARRVLLAPPQLFSFLMLVHLLSEVLAFTCGSFLLKRNRIALVFITSAACYSLKLYCYSVVSNPWWLLIIEALHGPCAAFRLTGTVAHVTTCAKKAERHFMEGQQQQHLSSPLQGSTSSLRVGEEKKMEDAFPSSTLARTRDAELSSQAGTAAAVDRKAAVSGASGGRLTSPLKADPTSPTVSIPVNTAEPGQKPELLATAYSIMWFAATGLPMALSGLLPSLILLIAPSSSSDTPARGYESHSSASVPSNRTEEATREVGTVLRPLANPHQPIETRLFRWVSLLLLVVAFLFVGYHRLRMFH